MIVTSPEALISIVAIPSEPHVYLVPLTLTFLPDAAVEPPNTRISLPDDGAANLILVDDSILRHVERVSPA